MKVYDTNTYYNVCYNLDTEQMQYSPHECLSTVEIEFTLEREDSSYQMDCQASQKVGTYN